MSDQNTSLPVRTEAPGDVEVKVVDGIVPGQKLTVNPDGSVNVTDNGGSLTVDAVALDIRHLTFATDKVDASGSTVELGATTLAALESITVQNPSGAGAVNIQDGGNSITVDAVALDIRHLTFATDKVDASGSVVALDAGTLAALESITVQNPSGAGAVNIQDGGNSITVDGTVELGATTLAALESITVQNPSGAGAVNIQDGGNSITVDGTVELGATTLAALESITVQNPSGAGAVNIQDGGNSITVDAVALDIRPLAAATDVVKSWILDEAGNPFSNTNPLPVVMLESEGAEINDYNKGSAVVAGSNSNHDYTVTAGKTLQLTQIHAAASGKLRVEVQIESGVGTGTFASKFVAFNSTANPNIEIPLREAISVAAGVRVRIIRTNNDNQPQDLYSTICGHEV